MNRLQKSTSPYLLQHADNPVDWYPWGEEAFALAKRENKPILISIGYSTCHWCHVMERESFKDKDVADFMNAFFVNIKVDREERPDLDAIYMDACEILTGEAGWPLNVFLTPDKKPFFAGTYFPIEQGGKRMSWFQALQYVLYNFREHKENVESQANRVLEKMKKKQEIPESTSKVKDGKSVLSLHFYTLLKEKFDEEFGGFGHGKKFPNTMALELLLHDYLIRGEEEVLNFVRFSTNKMLEGGIYDQLGGGISRYAVDREWSVPHFEKMLYDNALLISLLAKAHKVTGRRKYKLAAFDVDRFLEENLKSASGGYFSGMDADSEGKEGELYTWTLEEFEKVLGKEAALFAEYYGVKNQGNFEGKSILRQTTEMFAYAVAQGFEVKDFREKLLEARMKLLEARNKRPKPHTDEKVITSWNALLVSAYAHLFTATGEEEYLKKGENLLKFLNKNLVSNSNQKVFRNITNSTIGEEGVLKDYAFLAKANLDFYHISFDKKYLQKAAGITQWVNNFFSDDAGLFYFDSSNRKEENIFKRTDLSDEEMPSGNAVMAEVLLMLANLLGNEKYRQRSEAMVMKIKAMSTSSPLNYPSWASLHISMEDGIPEIALVGKNAFHKALELQKAWLPHFVMAASAEEDDSPMLDGKPAEEDSLIHVCQNHACQRPFPEVEKFRVAYSKFHVLATKR
jgi:uncharacterized protein YyaL (SSP411 family)